MGLHSVWNNKNLTEKKWSCCDQSSECQFFPNYHQDTFNNIHILFSSMPSPDRDVCTCLHYSTTATFCLKKTLLKFSQESVFRCAVSHRKLGIFTLPIHLSACHLSMNRQANAAVPRCHAHDAEL